MNETIGDKLKQLRIQAKLSQAELANQLFFSNRTISNWEKNLREVSIGNLKKIADFFKVPITYFTTNDFSLPSSKEVKKIYQEVRVKTIAIDHRQFFILVGLMMLNVLVGFIPFQRRENFTLVNLLLWVSYLVFTIVHYTNSDRARMKMYVVPKQAHVYHESHLPLHTIKNHRFINAFYYFGLFVLSLIFYSINFFMITAVDNDVIFASLMIVFVTVSTILHILYILNSSIKKPWLKQLIYQPNHPDFGMLPHRTMVTLHYGMIIFLIVLITAYGYQSFTNGLMLFNLFIGLFLILYLRIILMNNARFFQSYALYFKDLNTNTVEKLSE